jgi:hypothetical protein
MRRKLGDIHLGKTSRWRASSEVASGGVADGDGREANGYHCAGLTCSTQGMKNMSQELKRGEE